MNARRGCRQYIPTKGIGSGWAIRLEHLPSGEKISLDKLNPPTTRATAKKQK